MKELIRRQEIISEEVWKIYPMELPERVIFGFNSGKCDFNLVKYYFVKTISDVSDVNVAKKDNSYMFLLITPRFKFLDVRNHLTPSLSYNGWSKANGCATEKLIFPYEWLDDYDKLNHIGPVECIIFYSKLKGEVMITREEYDEFVREFKKTRLGHNDGLTESL